MSITPYVPNVKASTLPKSDDIVKREFGRGWTILRETLHGLRDYNEERGLRNKTPRLCEVISRITRVNKEKKLLEKLHQRRNITASMRMVLIEQYTGVSKFVPSVDQLVNRIKYTKNYLKMRKRVGDQRLEEGLAKIKAAGIQLRDSMMNSTGELDSMSDISKYARIEPNLRTKAEKEYMLNWIESRISPDGIIDNLFRRCDLPTKIAFVAGLKYRYYSKKTAMVYQNETAQEFFILISGSVAVFVNDDLNQSSNADTIAEFGTKGPRVAVLPTGFSFGEASLKGEGARRQATIIAEETCEVLIASQFLFNEVITQFNASSRATALSYFKEIWPFKGQRQDVFNRMGSCFDLVTLPVDAEIFCQGKLAENVYVLIEGTCKEMVYFQKKKAPKMKGNKGNQQNSRTQTEENKKPKLRIKDPAEVKELAPHHHAICNSSAVVVSQFSDRRLLGAYEVIKKEPCLTTIVTVGTCKALKAQLHDFKWHIQACPVLRQRIMETAKCQHQFVRDRKKQYRKLMKCRNPNIRQMASFVMDNRSYVHTPLSLLNKHVRRGSNARDLRQHEEVGDLYRAQRIVNVAREKTPNHLPETARLSSTMFRQEKLILDLREAKRINNEIKEQSFRYKSKLMEKERMAIPSSRVSTGRSPETLDMWNCHDQGEWLQQRLMMSREETNRIIHNGDMKRVEHQARGRFGTNTPVTPTPSHTRNINGYRARSRKYKMKKSKLPKLSGLEMWIDRDEESMMKIRSACLSPRGTRNRTYQDQHSLLIVNSRRRDGPLHLALPRLSQSYRPSRLTSPVRTTTHVLSVSR